MRVEKTDSTSRLSKFKAVCTTSSSELPQAIVTGSPDFKTKGFCPYTDKTAKKKARKEMSFLYFIVFIFNIAKVAIIGEIWKSRAKLLRNRLFEKIASVTG